MRRSILLCLTLPCLVLGCRESSKSPVAAQAGALALAPISGNTKTDEEIAAFQAQLRKAPPGDAETWAKLARTVAFDAQQCRDCLLRSGCTEASGGRGRTLSIAVDEAVQQQLRERIKTPQGRARLRERVAVEHDLSHIVYRQGDQARYFNGRKNLYDLRRSAAIQNLESIQSVNKTLPIKMAA